jgi:hypothetical protein
VHSVANAKRIGKALEASDGIHALWRANYRNVILGTEKATRTDCNVGTLFLSYLTNQPEKNA